MHTKHLVIASNLILAAVLLITVLLLVNSGILVPQAQVKQIAKDRGIPVPPAPEKQVSKDGRIPSMLEFREKLKTWNATAGYEDGLLVVETKGPDPQIWDFLDLESLEQIDPDVRGAITITYRSSKSGWMQVFYATPESGFSERQSRRVELRESPDSTFSEVVVPLTGIADDWAKLSDIRIDPVDESILTIKRVVWSPTLRSIVNLESKVDSIIGQLDALGKDMDPGWDDLSLRDIGSTPLVKFRREQALDAAKLDYLLYNRHRKNPADGLPNILLIINDAMHGHYLGFNDDSKALTPSLDRFAAQCVNFRNAISQASWTAPSMISILTGLYPNQHGCVEHPSRLQPLFQNQFLRPDLVTLQDVLLSHGYFTAALVGKNATMFRPALRGFYYVERSQDPKGTASIDSFLRLLESRMPKPFFVLLHIYDPHSPYDPNIPPILPADAATVTKGFSDEKLKSLLTEVDATGNMRVSKLKEMFYIREIEEIDAQHGKLFAFLKKLPSDVFSFDKDIIILTSDHGEEFEYRSGYVSHGLSPNIDGMRVPLLVKVPEGIPGVVEDYTENTSIYPTLLSLLGLTDPRPSDLTCPISLEQKLRDRKNKNDTSYVLNEAVIFYPEKTPGSREMKSLIRSDGYKLIFDTHSKRSQLYNLTTDPMEEHNLASDPNSGQLIEELKTQMEKRTNIHADYPMCPGTYLGHILPTKQMQETFGPPVALWERFGKRRTEDQSAFTEGESPE